MTKRVTAAELLEQLEKDPGFVARREQQDRVIQEKAATLRIEESPVVADLQDLGYDVASVWDLVNSPGNYADAIPILLTHLGRPYSSPIREGIARALGIPAALEQWPVLLDRYKCESDPRVKDGLAAALATIGSDSVIDSVVELVRDRANGPSRLLLLRILAKSRTPAAREVLTALQGEPLFQKEAKFLLRTSK